MARSDTLSGVPAGIIISKYLGETPSPRAFIMPPLVASICLFSSTEAFSFLFRLSLNEVVIKSPTPFAIADLSESGLSVSSSEFLISIMLSRSASVRSGFPRRAASVLLEMLTEPV